MAEKCVLMIMINTTDFVRLFKVELLPGTFI